MLLSGFCFKKHRRRTQRNVYNLKDQWLNTHHKKNVNHHYFLPQLLFTDLNNYFQHPNQQSVLLHSLISMTDFFIINLA